MSETTFKKSLYLNGYEFYTYNEFADFLIDNFNFAVKLVKDNSIFELLQDSDEELYNKIFSETRDYKYPENIITYLIYKLSDTTKYITNSHKFKSTYEIAIQIKRCYPEIDNEIKVLLSDKVLSKIFWEDYLFTKDSKHKRNHDFMINVENNSDYLFSYFYFLVVHLQQNDNLKFVLNNNEMSTIEEVTSYIYTNQKNIRSLISEIKSNHLILAIIASKTNINSTLNAFLSVNYLDMLCLIHELSHYDFRNFLLKRMSVWLSTNYQHYTYHSNQAKKLFNEYSLLVYKEDMSFMEMFSHVKYLDELYLSFITLCRSNKIIRRKTFIKPITDEYHLGYLHNEEIVCAKFLVDSNLVDSNTYKPEVVLQNEKDIVYNLLTEQSSLLERGNSNLEEYSTLYNKNRYYEVSIKFYLLVISSIFILLGVWFVNYNNYNETAKLSVSILSGISGVFIIPTILFLLTEYFTLFDIHSRNKKYKKLHKLINKTKNKVYKLKYFKKQIKVKKDDKYELVDTDQIVKKTISITYLSNIQNYYKKTLKLKMKHNINKEKDILTKISYKSLFVNLTIILLTLLGYLNGVPNVLITSIYVCSFIINSLIVIFTKKYYYLSIILLLLCNILIFTIYIL